MIDSLLSSPMETEDDEDRVDSLLSSPMEREGIGDPVETLLSSPMETVTPPTQAAAPAAPPAQPDIPPRVGTRRHAELMYDRGAAPAMVGTNTAGELPPGYVEHIPEELQTSEIQVPVEMVSLYDADTGWFKYLGDDDSKKFKVRLEATNAPELKNPNTMLGREYTRRMQDMVGGKFVLNRHRPRPDDPNYGRGQFGRRLGNLKFLDDKGRWVDLGRSYMPDEQEEPFGANPQYDVSLTAHEEFGLPFKGGKPGGTQDEYTEDIGMLGSFAKQTLARSAVMAGDLGGLVSSIVAWPSTKLYEGVANLLDDDDSSAEVVRTVMGTPRRAFDELRDWGLEWEQKTMAKGATGDLILDEDSVVANLGPILNAIDVFDLVPDVDKRDFRMSKEEAAAVLGGLTGEMVDLAAMRLMKLGKFGLKAIGKWANASAQASKVAQSPVATAQAMQNAQQLTLNFTNSLTDAQHATNLTNKFASGTKAEVEKLGLMDTLKRHKQRYLTMASDVHSISKSQGGDKTKALVELMQGLPEAIMSSIDGAGVVRWMWNKKNLGGTLKKVADNLNETLTMRPLDWSSPEVLAGQVQKSPRIMEPLSGQQYQDFNTMTAALTILKDMPKAKALDDAAIQAGKKIPKNKQIKYTQDDLDEALGAARFIRDNMDEDTFRMMFGDMDDTFNLINSPVTDNSVYSRWITWNRESSLGAIVWSGARNQKWMDDLIERFGYHAPLGRMTVDMIEELGGQTGLKLYNNVMAEAIARRKRITINEARAMVRDAADELKAEIKTAKGKPKTETPYSRPSTKKGHGVERFPIQRRTEALSLDKLIGNPVETAIIRAETMHIYAHRTLTKSTLMDAIIKDPEKLKLFTMGKNPEIINLTGLSRADKAKYGGLDETLQFKTYHDPLTKGGDPVTMHWAVKEGSLFFDTVNRMTAPNAGLLAKYLNTFPKMGRWTSGATNIMRKGVILGVPFIMKNAFRDLFSHSIFSKYGYSPILKPWEFARGLAHVISDSPRYGTVMAGGGGGGGMIAGNSTDAAVKAANVLEAKGFRSLLWDFWGESGGKWSGFFNLLAHEKHNIPKAISAGKRRFAASARTSQSKYQGKLAAKAAAGEKLTMAERVNNRMFDLASQPLYFMTKVTETLEEANRMGGAIVASNRMGRKTIAPMIDEAYGGIPGLWRMIKKPSSIPGALGEAGKRYSKQSKENPLFMKFKDAPAGMTRGEWKQLRNEARRRQDMLMVRNFRGGAGSGTLDFSTKGNFGEWMNSMYPFANVDMLDIHKFYRNMRDYPLTTLSRGFTFVTIPTAINWFANFDDPLHQAKSDTEKLLYYDVGNDPDTGRSFRLPRPPGWVTHFFGTMFEEYLNDLVYNDPKAIANLEPHITPSAGIMSEHPMLTAIKRLKNNGQNPIDFAQAAFEENVLAGDKHESMRPRMETTRHIPIEGAMESMDFMAGRTSSVGRPMDYKRFLHGMITQSPLKYFPDLAFAENKERELMRSAGTLAPQGLLGTLDIAMNYNAFFDQNVESRAMRGETRPSAELIYRNSTSPTIRKLHKALGIGGTGLSPVQIEYMVRKNFSSLGSMVMGLADTLLEASGNAPGDYERLFRDRQTSPAFSAFFSPPAYGPRSKPVSDLYKALARASTPYNDVRELENKGKLSEAYARKRQPDYWAPKEFLDKVALDLGDIWKTAEWIRNETAFTKEQKEFHISTLYMNATQLANAAVSLYEKYEVDPNKFLQNFQSHYESDPADYFGYAPTNSKERFSGNFSNFYTDDED